jgi:hypothetical protein
MPPTLQPDNAAIDEVHAHLARKSAIAGALEPQRDHAIAAAAHLGATRSASRRVRRRGFCAGRIGGEQQDPHNDDAVHEP